MKLWWVHNETMIATLMAFKATKQPEWWALFEKVSIVFALHITLLSNHSGGVLHHGPLP